MADSTDDNLNHETTAWCDRAEQVIARAPEDCGACLALVRDGILLRRRWDRLDPGAPQRRRLLTGLAAAQIACQRGWVGALEHAANGAEQAHTSSARIEELLPHLADDDGYLAELLEDHTSPPESVAFAVECFRDDVHWLGTLVAMRDGNRAIDFIGRVLLEQESLQRMMEARPDRNDTRPGGDLRDAATRLRTTALTRQAESLLGQPKPQDCQGWYRTWQAASRLAMRPTGATSPKLERAVEDYRRNATRGWVGSLVELPPEQRHAALQQAVTELADVSSEALTFLEDLPLGEAVCSLQILADDTATCGKTLDDHGGSELRSLRSRLRRQTKAVAAELQERRLAWRMERLFGHRAVAMLERLILFLLVLFVGMLVVEEPLIQYERTHWPASSLVEGGFAWLDLGICLVFLAEFSLKLWLARPRSLYFRRNWITGLLPAIPVGFVAYITHPDRVNVEVAGELFVLLRGLRYLRLPQMARWLRIARPVLRLARLAAFSVQASDRLIRRIGPLLNRNLVLFERAAIHVQLPPHRTALAALRERFRYRASEVLDVLSPSARERLVRTRIEDLTAMLSAPGVSSVVPATAVQTSLAREIPMERVIAWLLAATSASVSQRVGRSLAQSVARWCQAMDVFAVRRLPVVRDLVAAGQRRSPYGTTAEVANRIGSLLQYWVDRVYWIADLYGTLTAPQLVDSLGDWMVKGTARPARRLLTMGLAFLIVTSLAGLLPLPQLNMLTDRMERLIGTPLIALGLLCLVPLLVGLWFRQIAGEATDFCSQVAEAQFITATKKLKRRFAKRHHAVLYSRVIAPELAMAAAGEAPRATADDVAQAAAQATAQAAAQATASRDRSEPRAAPLEEGIGECPADPLRAAVELLFDDYLDGAPFHRSDTRTTTQLLGNLTLVSLRETRLRYGRRERKRLRRLDLANTRAWLRGPYLWFHFISRSLAQQTAKLVVDYNAHAVPLDRAATAEDRQIRRHVGWLCRRWNKPADQLGLPLPLAVRMNSTAWPNGPEAGDEGNRHSREFHGNDFTAVHFLSADPAVEDDIRARYGDAVADLMRRDRRDNVCRVFRTYPFYRWPKPQRTFNPLVLHSRYLAGGRVFLLPFRALWWTAQAVAYAARLLGSFVREVLNPTVGDLDAVADPDPFAVAVRKIHRMRKPVFLECLRMRADFDPEYLGVSLPGSAAYARRATAVPIEDDLARIDADPGIRREFRHLASQRHRQMLEFRRLLTRIDAAEQPPESLRAMAIAYTIDCENVRSRWEATRELKRAFHGGTADSDASGSGRGPAAAIRAWWCRWRYARRLKALFRQPAFADFHAAQRRTCRRLLCRRRGPLLKALQQLTREKDPADPLEEARRVLLAVARDPATWSRQLVVLRAVQTLSVLDLLTYCDLVAELGEYDTCTPEDAESRLPDETTDVY
ncbi:MAG: hypothetical protein JXB62_04445 [Pirellulales bacterium]|nr:hypothetical protein [Pirellulales bacterium]